MSRFEYEKGDIKIHGLPVWLDARNRRPLCIVSHAHSDHVGYHRRILCTEATLALLRTRQRVKEHLVLDYGKPHELAGAKITLFPAGHVLGSAQVLIETDGTRLLYTGDFNFGAGLTTGPAETVHCDTLLMECTYGHPRYVFPSREAIETQLGNFVERCFDGSFTPVILAYSLGKAQEAIKILEKLCYGALAHPQVWKICQVYKKFGVDFPLLDPLDNRPIGRRVVVFPPQRSARSRLDQLGPIKTMMLTGWAVDRRGPQLFGADEALPLSDHCDFPSLIRAAKESGAAKIFTHHGNAERFAVYLKAEGLDADPLVPPIQGKLF